MSAQIENDEDPQRSSDVEEGDDLKQQVPFDSSEDEEDDDEEEMQKIREGFIVDDEDDDRVERRKKKHKRRHIEPKEDEGLLDEDDLDLVMENSGATSNLKETSKFKRLKKAPVEESNRNSADLNDFFSDNDDDEINEEIDDIDSTSRKSTKSVGRTVIDELDDFIEDDEFSDLDEEAREEARQRRKQERLKPTELSGIDSEKVDELYDIFGDGEDYAWALDGEDEDGEYRDDHKGPQLEDIYEPEELKARMLTDSDKLIRDRDIPERYQELRKNIKEYDLNAEDFAFEQQWIAYKLGIEKDEERNIKGDDTSIDESAFHKAVADVLTFISRNNLEVPFIFAHRRDYLLKTTITGEGDDAQTNVETLLEENDLWRIVQLDIEFHSLLSKKKQVDHLIEGLDVDDEILEEAIASIQTITDVQDIHDYLNFQYGPELKDQNLKKSTRTTIFEKIRANKLFEIVQAFGISIKNYAENIVSDSKIFVTSDHRISPFDLADQICADEDSLYAKPSQAIAASKRYIAEEFFNNLKIRKYFREIYANYATIFIDLTESGRLKIDRNSPYADFKYAINRSVQSFTQSPDLFMRMLEAEAANLVEIRVEPISQSQLFEKLFELVQSEGQSEVAIEWNEYRRSVLLIATQKLFPLISLNLKETLRRECERILFFRIRDAFLPKVDQAPFTPKREYSEFGDVPRVLSISPGNGTYGQDSIIGALLDQNGKLIKTYKFVENPMIPRDKLLEGEISFDIAFSDAVREGVPDVIAINGNNVKTNKLFLKLREIIDYFQLKVDDSPIEVIYVNDEVAARYQHSQRAVEEFPDKSSLVRYTIALARYVQSPLLEYISLGEDITALNIHEHQSLISEDQLKQLIDTTLVDVVNMVGLDINKCVTSPYLASLLPYISGLGERKASGLLRAVQQHPLFSRQALITNESIRIGSNIFLNCSSFLRIPQNRNDAVKNNNDIEVVTLLDDTRIHPEDYALAEKIAADALDLDEEQIEELKDAPSGETIIDKLIQQGPELLKSLVLEDYSRQLEASYGKKKRATLEMIVDELQVPFQEIRNKFHILTANEVFLSLTGESTSEFYEGLVLPVLIKRVNRYQVNAVTSTQVDCTALPGDYADGSFTEKFQIGQTVQAKLLKVDYAGFTAEIGLAEKDVKSPALKRTFRKDAGLWDFNKEKLDTELEINKAVQSQKKIRFINHPAFQNLNVAQAQTFLAPKKRGSYVIRPSSKGFDHITITWKVDNNLYQNIDVVEHDKESENSIGRKLTIDGKEFSDLDEIIDTYIAPTVHNVELMMDHEKYHEGSKEEVAKWLENFSKANPDKGTYGFALNRKRPGSFILMFKTSPTSELFSWNVRVIPTGYDLFNYQYPNVLGLCNGFKTILKTRAAGGSNSRGNVQSSSARPSTGNYNQGYNNSGYNRSNYNAPGYGNSGYGNSNSNNTGYNSNYNNSYYSGYNQGYSRNPEY